MACRCRIAILFVLSGVVLAALIAYLRQSGPPLKIAETAYWGPAKIGNDGSLLADDVNIYKVIVSYNKSMLTELKAELERTKYVDPLEGAAYHYGVNLKTFRLVIDYWTTIFDFQKAQNEINAYPNYQTEIEGLKVHFFRSAPVVRSPSVKVLPLMMVHGWPGSFVEFLDVARLLSQPVDGVAFDVIVPSIPGYGFSQASSKQGMDALVTARIFSKLMTRLGYDKFYMQGGDWGSVITNAMAALYPERLRGIHLNMMSPHYRNLWIAAKVALFNLCPATFGDSGKLPSCMPVPFGQHFLHMLLESGYLHIQATKPDTVGLSLLNSPAGLAAYILEKFSTGTHGDFRSLDDGGLTKKISLDKLLANVMVYYASGSILSSLRFYKENIVGHVSAQIYSRPIRVPTGYAIFPNEIVCVPRFLAQEIYPNITTITYHDDGGHFAALEKPAVLQADVRAFVEKVEILYPERLSPPGEFKVVDLKQRIPTIEG